MRLSRDDILKANDLITEEHNIPEWGGTVLVRGLSGTERDAFEASIVQVGRRGDATPDLANMRAKLVVRSVVDDDGNRVFADADIPVLGAKSAAALTRVFEVAQRLSGLSDEDVKELAGNSGAAQSGGSTSP